MTPREFAMWKLTLLTAVWTLAVAYAAWFGFQVWDDPGLMLYAGHRLSLLVWGAPLLPVLLLSWWLLKRWTTARLRILGIFLLGWIALICLPVPPSPMSVTVPGQPTVTTISPLFWLMVGLVSIVPATLTAAVWFLTVAARQAVRKPAP